ncbi:MAG TPA: M48 family metallopeptidase [Bryobacteraceae bacterium]
MKRRLSKLRKSALVAALLAAPAAFGARMPGDSLRPGFNLFSKEQDVALGQEAAAEVRKQFPPVRNQFLQDYVRRIGDRLADSPEARECGFRFTFTVVNRPEVNAFALPGGPMFVFTGLIQSLDNEAQLAGAMAHEMSHVILRHGTHEASKANMLEIPLALASMVIGNRSFLGQVAKYGLNLGANSFILKFSRDAESEADAMGAHLMAEAGYDPIELARFFRKLQEAGGQGNTRLAQFLSDHPNPGNRVRAIEEEIQTMPRRRYGYETGDFERAYAAMGPARKRR